MIKKLIWLLRGKPTIYYNGFNCGCCGSYVKEPLAIRNYESCGEWGDTWGLCPKCRGDYKGGE